MGFFKLNHDERFEIRKQLQSESQMMDFLVDFFEDKALTQYKLVK